MFLTKEEKRQLIELISREQIEMIVCNPNSYEEDRYKELEQLKMRVGKL